MTLDSNSALRHAASLLRLADTAGPAPEVEGEALVCTETGRSVAMRDGVVDLLGSGFAPNLAQRMLDTAPSAWLYVRLPIPK